jgi:ankyrin repeat protein
MTALHESLFLGDEEMTRWIIEQDNVKLNAKDQHNQTPLMKGCVKAKVQFLYKFMSKPGVDISLVDQNGKNIIHILALNRRWDFFQFMTNKLEMDEIERFSKLIFSKDSFRGFTPMHYAVETADFATTEALSLLIQRLQGDVLIPDNHNQTPCSYAHKLIQTLQDINDEEMQTKIKELKSIHSYLLLKEVKSKNTTRRLSTFLSGKKK